jgi:manganese-dependent inorganic pyrophosphatase
MYRESAIEITKTMALLMCSAILSDTLIFKSPTCTWEDEAAARDLAVIAEIDPESYGREMFRAGSNLSEKSESEIFYQDFKRFAVNDTNIGVGQVNVMGMDEVKELVNREIDYIPETVGQSGLDMTFLLVTDIMSESSYAICAGKNAEQVLKGAFNVEIDEYPILLKGVVSRKKQFLPAIMDEMQS